MEVIFMAVKRSIAPSTSSPRASGGRGNRWVAVRAWGRKNKEKTHLKTATVELK